MNPIKINIHKPLFGYTACVRRESLMEAIRNGVKVELTIGDRTELIDPKEWMETGQRVEQVFKIPTRPMVLYRNSFKVKTVKQIMAELNPQMTLFGV